MLYWGFFYTYCPQSLQVTQLPSSPNLFPKFAHNITYSSEPDLLRFTAVKAFVHSLNQQHAQPHSPE